jgi:hypothetical protein
MSHRSVSDSKFLLRHHTLRPFLFGLMFFFFTVLFSCPVFAQTTSTLVGPPMSSQSVPAADRPRPVPSTFWANPVPPIPGPNM